MRRSLLVLVFAVTLVSCLLLLTGPAFGWANGELQWGYGTHDWVLDKAYQLAGKPTWFSVSTARAATDDPDYYPFQDWAYHNYAATAVNGDARIKVQQLFAGAVSQYSGGSSISMLSTTIGRMAHYFADINNPMHTAESPAETSWVHSMYEIKVDTFCRSATDSRSASWVRADGLPAAPVNPYATTEKAAQDANRNYDSLVSNRTIDWRTSGALNRAANDLADLIVSIRLAAGR